MELIVTLAMKFWMWTILIALIIIGFIVNLFDKKQPKLYTFAFTDYPLMRPIKAAPDQLDISFTLLTIQFILEPPFYLILALTLRCLFHATKPPSLNDQYAK